MSLKEEFMDKVDSLSDELVELLRGMIQRPSENPPGNESEVADFILSKMTAFGLDAKSVEPKPNRVNALGTLHGTGEKKAFLYNGHIDVVPAGNLELWSVDPYEGVVKEGRVYGRGTGDMKGASACALIAAKALKEAGIQLNGDFLIHCVADEERGSTYGTKHLIEKGHETPEKVAMAVVGEGSVHEDKIYTQLAIPGSISLRIIVKGKAAHGSRPWEGVNAVVKMSKIILALNEHRLSFSSHPLLPDPSVIIGRSYKVERDGSSIPMYAESTYSVRSVPGMTIESVSVEVNQVIEDLKVKDPEIDAEILPGRYGEPSTPLNTPESEKLFKIADNAVRTAMGYELKPYQFGGGNDTRLLRKIGIPTIVMGPADIFRYGGHRPNEWVSIDRLVDFAKIYGLMAMEVCGVKS
ncbi:N-formyl-4-amino-5-aminomethyl-2-methylpyrimidine deformylase [subsurface metagenome]